MDVMISIEKSIKLRIVLVSSFRFEYEIVLRTKIKSSLTKVPQIQFQMIIFIQIVKWVDPAVNVMKFFCSEIQISLSF